MQTKMVRSCSAINCTNKYSKDSNITFYKFPFKHPELLKQWLINLGRKNFVPNRNSHVCSAHFEDKCFLKGYVNIRKLAKYSVPTLFSFPKHPLKGKMESEVLNTIKEEQDDASYPGFSRMDIKTEPIDGNLEELDCDTEASMEPLCELIKTEPDFEGAIKEESFASTENKEVMGSCEYAVKRDEDNEEVLMEPLFVPIKTEPDFEETSEGTLMEENLEETARTEDCTTCTTTVPGGENSVTKTHLVDSASSSITSEKPFRCTTCNKTFTTKSNLVFHVKLHSDERPFKCAICEMSFKSKGVLGRHIRRHTGEKPFKCTECDKAFLQSSQLTIHMRSHTGEKPYLCTICGKTFAQRGALTYHTRVHSGEKPFACERCDKCFTTMGGLQRHRQCVRHGFYVHDISSE